MGIQELALPAPPVMLQQDQVIYIQVLAAFAICMLLPWICGAAGASLNPIIGQYSQKNLLHSVLMMAKPSHIGWALPSSSHVNQRTVHHHRPCITTCCASPQAVHHHRLCITTGQLLYCTDEPHMPRCWVRVAVYGPVSA
jgi:hypothetical protein